MRVYILKYLLLFAVSALLTNCQCVHQRKAPADAMAAPVADPVTTPCTAAGYQDISVTTKQQCQQIPLPDGSSEKVCVPIPIVGCAQAGSMICPLNDEDENECCIPAVNGACPQ